MINTITINIFLIFASISTVRGGCGQTRFVLSDGTLNFEGSSITSTSCTYTIQVPSRVVELRWSSFDIPGKMPSCGSSNYVKIYIGCNTFSPYYLTTFCSSNMNTLPHNIYAKDGCMKIEVRTEASGRFKASYSSRRQDQTYFSTSRCSSSRKLYSSSGVIASPNWPISYQPRNFPSGLFVDDYECEWDIKLSSTKKLLQMNFMDVDLYSYSSSCRSDERVKMKGEKSVLTSTKSERKYCRKNPFSVNTKYYELEIEMEIDGRRSSSSYNNRGFVVGWVAYEDDEAASKTKWGWIVGGVVMSVFFFVFFFCCCRYMKRRKANNHVAIKTTTTYGAAPHAAQPILQKPAPYSQQGYIPTQTYPQQPMAGYPQQQPYPPTAQYPTQQPYPPPAQPYGQNYTVPQQDKPLTSGYPDQAPPPYPGPPNDSMGQPPTAPPASAPYPPPQ